MQLTPDVVIRVPSFINAIHEKTISLRGLEISTIENLEVTNDINECIDLTDNDITFLGYFPKLFKLRTLLAPNNRISTIDNDIAISLPNLTKLSLSINNINNLSELYKLKGLASLKALALDNNPVTANKHYRLFVIRILPHLEVLDFERVKKAEREQAKKVIGDNIVAFLKKQKEAVAEPQGAKGGKSGLTSAESREEQQQQGVVRKLSEEDKNRLKQQLLDATSLDEMAKVEQQLKQGFW